MSSMIIKAVYPGEKVENLIELRNSWLGAALIWNIMYKRYINSEGSFLLPLYAQILIIFPVILRASFRSKK